MKQPFGQTLIGGDSWNWTLRLDACASGSIPKYFLRGTGTQSLDLVGTPNTDGSFSFTASGEQTLALVGELAWQLCIFDAGNNRTELARGTVSVIPDIQSAEGGVDARSWNKRMLDAVCAVLEGRASRVEKLYQIAGRHIELIPASELLQLKGDLQAAYDRELVASGQKRSGSNQVKVGFGRSSGRFGEWH